MPAQRFVIGFINPISTPLMDGTGITLQSSKLWFN